ncbi:MAG: hypothetical protein ACI9C4_001714 [Paraglaciecola sp.]|jgi:hypothetical protein
MSCGELYIYFVVKVVCTRVLTVPSVTATVSLQAFYVFYLFLCSATKVMLASAYNRWLCSPSVVNRIDLSGTVLFSAQDITMKPKQRLVSLMVANICAGMSAVQTTGAETTEGVSFKIHISALHQATAMIFDRVLMSISAMTFTLPKRQIF